MKILILGSHGRLGNVLLSAWNEDHDVRGMARPVLDVTDAALLRTQLEDVEFDVLLNATGATNVDRCESEQEEAQQVNVDAPRIMAEVSLAKGARFIHFSTDYVFDGEATQPYDEDAPANPLGIYGETKRDGESAVLAVSAQHVVMRVAWVFGPSKPSFPDAIIAKARTESHVEAIADKVSSPTSAADIATWVVPFFDGTIPGGLYHACNAGECSWQEYGAYALACAREAGVALATHDVHGSLLADMAAFVAPRPRYSVLSTAKLTHATGITPRPWQDALREYIHKKYAPILSTS